MGGCLLWRERCRQTSLLQAGILPALGTLGLRGYIISHPSLDPLRAAGAAGVVGAAEDLALALRAAGPRPLLILDHAEELALAGRGPTARNLLQQLARILESPTDSDPGLTCF